MKFRKRPVIIEAEQYFKGKTIEGICLKDCVEQYFKNKTIIYGLCLKDDFKEFPIPHIHTLEGEMTVSEGDWIITGIAGEKYPCKDSIFKETYEVAE